MVGGKTLCVIPARGGSKGIPHKNIRILGGKPLIAWSIEVALMASSLSDVVVSTDDPEIARIAKELGAQVPFMRPDDLAADSSPTLPVLQHALAQMENLNQTKYDAVLLLEPTSPLRSVDDIENAIKIFYNTDADSVISVCKLTHTHPMQIKKIVDDELVPFAMNEPEGIRRQDLKPDAYIRNGAIYITRKNILLSGSIRGKKCRPHIMSPERSVNIDDEIDFLFAETLLQHIGRSLLEYG
ncbi:MAG: hypothetical protein VR65_07950 [Desulfobulbaceae bacterium BRH_c16a]|nr:MAG: hypothetical protein VR65_07950 [Desulfobulbaceae bacterium BRH_c16a]